MSSWAEDIIANWLNEAQLKYETEKTFKDLKDKGHLRYDFFLPDYWCLIEVDGLQHEETNKYWGGEEQLKDRQKKDKIKDQYAIDHSYHLIRIPTAALNIINKKFLINKIQKRKYSKVTNLGNIIKIS